MNKINTNIEGYNAEGICVGCLHYNRKMFPASEANECFRLLGNIEIPAGRTFNVCWECLAAMRSVSRFQAQLVKSFEVLMNYSKKHRYLENPFDLSKHSATRLTSQVVSKTSTEWQPDAGSSNKDPADSQQNNRPPEEGVKIELEVSNRTDPLAHSDSDCAPFSPVASEPDSDDEMVLLANKLSHNPTYANKSAPIQQGRGGDSVVNPEQQAKTLDWLVGSQKQILHILGIASQKSDEQLSQVNRDYREQITDSLFGCLKRITNLEELQEMESLVSDKEYRRKLVSSCAMLCSKGNNGTNCAYRLLDIVFSREFLCECSWAGGTRSEGEKVCFKFYQNTINFFFETIQQWDSTYTLEQNDTFLKMVLRNAKKRCAAKLMRRSTMRRRHKRRKIVETRGSATGDTSYPPPEIASDLNASELE